MSELYETIMGTVISKLLHLESEVNIDKKGVTQFITGALKPNSYNNKLIVDGPHLGAARLHMPLYSKLATAENLDQTIVKSLRVDQIDYGYI